MLERAEEVVGIADCYRATLMHVGGGAPQCQE